MAAKERRRKNDHNALLGYMLVPGLRQIRLFFLIVGGESGWPLIKHSVPHGKLVAYKSYIYVIKIFNFVEKRIACSIAPGLTGSLFNFTIVFFLFLNYPLSMH